MKQIKVAGRYAKALFELALEYKVESQVRSNMELVFEICNDSKDLTLVFNSPVINDDKKIAIFKTIFAGKINELSQSFLTLLVKKNREANIREIAQEYVKIFKEYKGIRTATVKSASPINQPLREKIISMVKAHSNCEVELVEEVNEKLIGGFILKINDEQYDASILSKFKQLKKELKLDSYQKKN